MDCDEARTLLDPYVDDELDVVRSLNLDEHLRSCTKCAAAVAGLKVLRNAMAAAELYHRAPAHLARRVQRLNRGGTREWLGASLGWPAVAAGGWAVAAALVMLLLIATPRARRAESGGVLGREIIAAHIRSLMPGHLTDVLSSNQHTVKPWFEGKVNFSPKVTDLTQQGFPLIGGRLDYVDGRLVAAIVYRHGAHPINLFVWASEAANTPPVTGSNSGYNLIHWKQNGESFWAVSSVSEDALQQFVAEVRQPPPGSSSK